MAHRRNPTMFDIIEQTAETGEVPGEFLRREAGLPTPPVPVPPLVQPSTPIPPRPMKRRGKVKVPKIGDWKRTPKQRGLKQGHQWQPPAGWRPPSGHFYIFPAPNKRSQGATMFFYVTDGTQVLSTQHRTKSEAVKALKGILSGAEAQLRVNSPSEQKVYATVDVEGPTAHGRERYAQVKIHGPGHEHRNPLTRHETAQVRAWERDQRRSGRQDYQDAEAGTVWGSGVSMDDVGQLYEQAHGKFAAADAYGHVADKMGAPKRSIRPNPNVVEVAEELDVYGENPLTGEEAGYEMERGAGDLLTARRMPLGPARSFAKGRGMGQMLTVSRQAERQSDREDAQAHMMAEAKRRPNVDAHGMPGTLIPAYGRDYKTQKAVKEDWYGGKDFLIADITSRWDGKPMSIRDVPEGWRGHIQIRFDGLRKLWVYTGGKKRKNPRRPRKKRYAKPPAASRRHSAAKKQGRATDVSTAQFKLLEQLSRKPLPKTGATIGQASTARALCRRGLALDQKTQIKISAKGRKLLKPKKIKPKTRRSNPSTKHKSAVRKVRKNARPRPARSQAKRRTGVAVYTFTVPLEKGKSGAKCKISYPRGLFKTQAEALRNIQGELRARFKQLKKAPQITSCTWKYTDAARTKGKWHFTAKKKAK